MTDKKHILIEGTISKLNRLTGSEKPIQVKCYCKDEYAVTWFSDKKLGEKIAKAESKEGKDIKYDSKLKLVVERLKGKDAKEVARIMCNEMKKAGGSLQIK